MIEWEKDIKRIEKKRVINGKRYDRKKIHIDAFILENDLKLKDKYFFQIDL